MTSLKERPLLKHPARIFSVFILLLITSSGLFFCGGGGGATKSHGNTVTYQDCRSGQITVWGEAPVFTSVSAARDKAKKDACRTAVQKCIGEQVAAISGVADGQSVTSEIFTNAQGLCRNDQIIEENEYMLDTVKMKRVYVRFSIDTGALENQIDTMQKMVGNPKVIVLIREVYNLPGSGKRIEGFSSRNGMVSSSVRDYLRTKGYSIIDSNAAGRVNEADVAENPENIPNDLKDRAMKAGADVLIVGTVEANAQTIENAAFKGSGLKSFKATGNVSILSLWGRGGVLGDYNDYENGAQTTDLAAARAALKRYAVGADPKKGKGLAQFIHGRLSDEWASQTRNNVILMNVSGLNPDQVGTFRDDLVERTAVKNVNEIESRSGHAVWEVVYPGRSFALAETLGFYGEDPRMFVVVKMTGKKLKVSAVKRGEISVQFY